MELPVIPTDDANKIIDSADNTVQFAANFVDVVLERPQGVLQKHLGAQQHFVFGAKCLVLIDHMFHGGFDSVEPREIVLLAIVLRHNLTP